MVKKIRMALNLWYICEERSPTRRRGVRWDALRCLRAQSVEKSARAGTCLCQVMLKPQMSPAQATVQRQALQEELFTD